MYHTIIGLMVSAIIANTTSPAGNDLMTKVSTINQIFLLCICTFLIHDTEVCVYATYNVYTYTIMCFLISFQTTLILS